MRLKIFIIIFLFSVIFNVVFVIHLQSDRQKSKHSHDKCFVLDKEQEKRIKEESEEILNQNSKLEKKLNKCKQDLYDLLNSDENDMKEIEKCITTLNEIQKNIQINTVKHLLIYKKNMTKEQCKCFLQRFGENMDLNQRCNGDCVHNK